MHPLVNRHFESFLRDEKDRLTPGVLAFIKAIDEAFTEVESQARRLAEDSIRTRTEQILRHQDALHELALTTSEDLNGVLRNIIRISARTLNVDRAGIWLFNA